MSHTVDKSLAVIYLFVKYPGKECGYLLIIVYVADIFAHAVEHLLNLDVSSAVERTLERADSRADSRICVCTRGRENSAGEGGVVTAAVLRLNDHAKVEKSCFLLCVLLVGAKDTQKVLRCSDVVVRLVQVKALSEIRAAVDRIGMRRDYRELCDYINALTYHIFKTRIVGVFVVGIERENAYRHFVHY